MVGAGRPGTRGAGVLEEVTSEVRYFDYSCSVQGQIQRLGDAAKVGFYRAVIRANPSLFRGKVVLDVGAGAGLLALLAAEAGASLVVALEVAALAPLTELVARANTSRIKVVRGEVGEVELPVPSVDVIVSDWAGPALLHESLAAAVLAARDRWLTAGGAIVPDRATLTLAATSARVAEGREWWRNVWGFDMSAIERRSLGEAQVEKVAEREVVTDSCLVAEISLYTCTKADLWLTSPWSLTSSSDCYIGGLLLYWSLHFSPSSSYLPSSTSSHSSLPLDLMHTLPAPLTGLHSFSTTPGVTGAKQVVMGLSRAVTLREGETMEGYLTLLPDLARNRSLLSLRLGVHFEGALDQLQEELEYTVI